jgi:hypothetical protein
MVKERVMKRVVCGLLVGIATGNSASWADGIRADLALVVNGESIIFGDGFDNGVIEPFWQQSGSPGPEHDTVLDLKLGDGLEGSFEINPALTTVGIGTFELTTLDPGSFILMVFKATDPADILGLGLAPDGAFFLNEAGLLGAIPLVPAPVSQLTIVAQPDGSVFATVNGQSVFEGFDTFGPAAGISISYVPEPTALAALLIGSILGGPFRRVLRRSRP